MSSGNKKMSSPVDLGFSLQRRRKVVLVVDLVESVSLMQADELGVITRWQAFLAHVNQVVLPANEGRLVKSLGDGLMVEFEEARQAAAAARAMHEWMATSCAPLATQDSLALRAGLHSADFYADEHDIYGAGVNLAARIATLCGPGETIATSAVRDELIDGLDGMLSDLGHCYLKHVEEPVRVWRIGAAGPRPVLHEQVKQSSSMQPTIGVIPFQARSNEPEHLAIGDLIADTVIERLSRNASLNVVSRLSTSAFRAQRDGGAEASAYLNATYMLTGSYVAHGGKLVIHAEILDAASNQMLKATRLSGDVNDLLQLESQLGAELAQFTLAELSNTALQRALERPLPTLSSYSLKLGGLAMMHRSSTRDFERSRDVLDALVDRHRRVAGTRAWLAKWHILRVVRGISPAPEKDARQAIEQTQRALDIEPDSALALAIEGHALCQLSGDVALSGKKIEQAISLNPSEPMAWLYKSVWSSMWGSQAESVSQALHARRLSPTDPISYYFDMILAGAYAFNGDHDEAIEMAERALRLDMHQAPALRALLVAQGESGRMEDAQHTLQLLMREVPHLTIASYKAMGSSASDARQRVIHVLRALGVRES